MNCKPGDLAVTHSAPLDNGIVVEVIDRPSEADARGIPKAAGPCWLVRTKGSLFHMTPTTRAEIAIWPDSHLRPIRDPGDDARDETLDWLPVPHKELA